MSVEQLFGIVMAVVLPLLTAVYGGLLYEIRKLRKAKHRQAQYLQWCCLAIAILANKVDVDLPDMKENDE